MMLFHRIWCFHITVYYFRNENLGNCVREESFVLAFFVTLEFLTLTLSCYKTEAKNLKEKTKEATCLETAIKFSIGSLCPKFLHFSMHLSLPVT